MPFGIACAVLADCWSNYVNVATQVDPAGASAALRCKALGFSPIMRDSVFTNLNDSIRRKLLSE